MGKAKKSILQLYLVTSIFIVMIIAFTGCFITSLKTKYQPGKTASVFIPTSFISTGTTAPVVLVSLTPTSTILFTPTALLITTSTNSFSPTPDSRLKPNYWREWPVSPDLSPRAREILQKAILNPDLDLHTFSKVGDCQMTSGTFLNGFANGIYSIPDGYDETVSWFSNSMKSESVTAANGLGISSVLNPMFGLAAGNTQCQNNETPLDCELRSSQPVVVLIAMGTNWAPNAELSFENYLRVVVERIMETGAIPILATKADNIEQDWKLDLAIAQVAYDYDLPLVNVWRSVQDLPNHGLESPKNIYLTGDGWMRTNYAWLDILEKVRLEIVK
jgi:hypothetical protein